MSIKKYTNNTFVDEGYKKYETATDTITSLPQTIIGDGQPISAYTIKGNMQQSGTPTPSNPVYPAETGDKTANLLCMKNGTHTYSAQGITVTVTDNNLATFSGTATAAGGRYTRLSDTFTLQAGTYKYRKYGTSTATPYIQNSTSGTILYSPFTISEPTDVFFGVNVVEGTNYTGTTMQVMLTDSNYDGDYEPYGQYKIPISFGGVTYNSYHSEPIRKIGNVVDTSVSSGTDTYNICKLVLTGQESWNISLGVFYLGTITDDYLRSSGNITYLSSHYNAYQQQSSAGSVPDKYFGFGDNSSVQRLYVHDSTYSTVQDFQAYLSAQYANGTPVTIWYILATPTTETFTAPSIPTSGSPQSFDVDTTLKPSEVSLTYHGWHEHSDTKFTTP